MKSRLLSAWLNVIESFWLVPTLMAFGAFLAAIGSVRLDAWAGAGAGVGWAWSGSAEGARSLLSTVASSMINVAGTVFSITIAALTLASQQFGPRLLRNFTADRGNQLVLGTFIATFLFCLMVDRAVRSDDTGTFVPNISVSVALLLACASLGVLIYFIHHVSSSIQAENLLHSVWCDFEADLRRLPADDAPPAPEGPPPEGPGRAVRATAGGYLQGVDRDDLVATCAARGITARLGHRAGDYVSRGETLLTVWGAKDDDDGLDAAVRGSIHLGSRRTSLQDLGYGLRQLSEIGTRALSPAFNDPFTAMGAVDWMTDALVAIAARPPGSGVRRDGDGAVRLVEPPESFGRLLQLGLGPIRDYGAGSALVCLHLMAALERLADCASQPEARTAVVLEAEALMEAGMGRLSIAADRDRLGGALTRVRAAATAAGRGRCGGMDRGERP